MVPVTCSVAMSRRSSRRLRLTPSANGGKKETANGMSCTWRGGGEADAGRVMHPTTTIGEDHQKEGQKLNSGTGNRTLGSAVLDLSGYESAKC